MRQNDLLAVWFVFSDSWWTEGPHQRDPEVSATYSHCLRHQLPCWGGGE